MVVACAHTHAHLLLGGRYGIGYTLLHFTERSTRTGMQGRVHYLYRLQQRSRATTNHYRKHTMAKQTTQVAAVATEASEAVFRVVVRGTNTDGVRVRRVRNIAESAYMAGDDGEVAKALAAGLVDPTYRVYPPVGNLCRGGLSRGWVAHDDGTISRVAKVAA